MLNDVEAMLSLADEHIAEIAAMYERTLHEQEIPARLKALIKGVIEQQRSSLDFVTNAVAIKHGTAKDGDRIYWPYATVPTDFDRFFDRNLPGVRPQLPKIVGAWEGYQPYQPGFEWIAALIYLAKGNKHRTLTPQTRIETRMREHRGPQGSVVRWNPANVQFGSGVYLHGQRVDPATQTAPGTTEMIYVDWLFEDTGKSALATLRTIQKGIRPMLQDLCDLAAL